VLDDTLGVKINSVLGYAGGNEIDIAVEKGDVLCRGMTIAPHFGREPFDGWHKRNFDRNIVQTAEKRDSRIADVPTLYEVFEKENTADESRRVADVILRGGDFGRPMLVGSGTPVERVNILREAYATDEQSRTYRRGEKSSHGYGTVHWRTTISSGPTSHDPTSRRPQVRQKTPRL
jgi:hypothetical protein